MLLGVWNDPCFRVCWNPVDQWGACHFSLFWRRPFNSGAFPGSHGDCARESALSVTGRDSVSTGSWGRKAILYAVAMGPRGGCVACHPTLETGRSSRKGRPLFADPSPDLEVTVRACVPGIRYASGMCSSACRELFWTLSSHTIGVLLALWFPLEWTVTSCGWLKEKLVDAWLSLLVVVGNSGRPSCVRACARTCACHGHCRPPARTYPRGDTRRRPSARFT